MLYLCWGAFRLDDPVNANIEQTQIKVNVYKIVSFPIWHTGTVIDGRKNYVQMSNRVETCNPRGRALDHHRTMVRLVPGNLEKVRSELDTVIERITRVPDNVRKELELFFNHFPLPNPPDDWPF
ncbi:hypothetical protein ABIE66_002331 [Peribacillus sp. B2I2]|uniref:hypothetical protein n=1 Tax=Peribacillus sp. B2I2 TaxID=3156468 RepID=UPI00351564B3